LRRILLGAVLLLSLVPARARAQESAWDSPRALQMIEQARTRRALPYEDSALRNYRANAHGYIYFYLDRESADELTLVKVDQVALEVYWAFPGSTKQRIVGLRDESVLPNRMRYHLDHLTVVQNEFGDRIQLGDGDEVQSVVHPIAPESERWYHFRLADSMSLRLGNVAEPLRVYEIEVRPRDPGAPGIVGSLFLDAAQFDIVRMDFTFTRSSYVDRRLDYIRISLENGLWQGRFWLPFEQRVELRRQLPELDFPAGAVIRGHMEVRDYEFNLPLPPGLFRGPAVTAVPRSSREAYPFEEELFAELSDEGLAADPDLEALRDEAAGLIGQRFLEGLPPLRLDLRGSSSVLRFDRTERLHLGLGLSYRLSSDVIARAGAGYSFGTEEPTARLGLDFDMFDHDVETRAWWNEPRDLGYQATAGVMNTLSALAAEAGAEFGHDFRDTWFSRGVSLGLSAPEPLFFVWRARVDGTLDFARDPLSLVDGYEADPDDELNRPLAEIDQGRDLRMTLAFIRAARSEAARSWDAELELTQGRFARDGADDLEGYGRAHADISLRTSALDRDWRLVSRLRGGATFSDAPIQHDFLLGGMGTVPGYAFRSYAGQTAALLQTELRHELRAPWISTRVSAAAGWTDDHDGQLTGRWGTRDGVVGPSLGLGVGLVNEILWLDLWRGLDRGDWEFLVTVDPELWDIL
jgi:hypothetical protein